MAVIENPLPENIKNPLHGGIRKNLPKIIFLVLAILILIQAFSLVKSFREAPPPLQKFEARQIGDASLLLKIDKYEYKVGDQIMVQLRIDTGGHPANGTDV